ncbi:Fatty acid synthase [Mycena kentingensis (nom. inval.)]|nr:Fatty acid synthase [Mycena kentingensis (nom. inval.)]
MDEDVYAAQRTENYHYPFANEDEWGFGRFLTMSSLRMREIDELLKLPIVQKHLLPHLSFKSAKELRQRVELLPTGPRWVAQTIKYAGFPTKRPIVLFYRNSLDCAQFLLRHPTLKNHIDFIPTMLTQGGERVHKEWINSNGAWQMQVTTLFFPTTRTEILFKEAIPAGRTVLGIVASSDKTNISVMNGDRVAHPFLLSLANIRSEVASKASSNAFIMTALLPVPRFLCAKKLRGIMEKRLLHQCLDIVCGPLKLAARDGASLSTSDGCLIMAHTPLVSYIVDTPEAADLSGVKGKTSHLTMASHKTFGDAVRQPERAGASTWEAICSLNARVSPDDVAAYQKAAKAHPNRLSGVHLPFWRDWPLSTNPSQFLTPEVLHHIHKAFFDHDFQWGRTILGDAEMDFRLSVLHPRSGSRHFQDGVTRLKQLGGREHRDLERSFISIIAEAAPREVVCALRALMDFRFMAQAPQINESTLVHMEALLAQFHELKHHIIEANGREQDHFNIPKLELLHSIVPSIRWAGVPMQYTADITEKAHSTQIKVPARTETNHRDYDPQIVRHLDRAEKLRLFTLYTNTRTEGLDLDLDDPGEEEDEEDASGSSLGGESNGRTMRNLFQAAVIYPNLYPGTETRFETTPSTACLLNRRASLASISVEDAASMFAIPDFRAGLGDYFSARGQTRSPLIAFQSCRDTTPRRPPNPMRVAPFSQTPHDRELLLPGRYALLFPGRAPGISPKPETGLWHLVVWERRRKRHYNAVDNTDHKAEATVELTARSLGNVAKKTHEAPECAVARTSLLHVLNHFISTYLVEADVHSLASYDIEVRKTVLSAFFLALAILRAIPISAQIPTIPKSALLSAVAGNKATTLYDIYTPLVAPFLATLTENALVPLAEAQNAGFLYNFGLDVVSRLSGATPRPSTAYLASVPVSFPLIGFTQLVQYLVACNVAGVTPGEFRGTLAGATGHSQGIVSAVAISASTSFESFTANALKALKWLFFSGLRGQQAFPIVALEPGMINDAVEGGGGTPSPMLSVTDLKLTELESHIKKTNAHLSDNVKINLSLHNGPHAFVVTGPARSLYDLATSLRKVRAPSGLDQSKTPFSQRKPVFSVCFLVVGVPYHSEYLAGQTEKLMEEDLAGEEIDLRQLSTSIIRSLCEQIFTKHIHWPAATNFPETATHAVDFGPGGVSGIGPLTAKNLDGRGVRVIVVGDRAKGDAELFDVKNVKHEDWWSKNDGNIYIDTPFSRLLGKAPIMVAAMTPSTVKASFVSAVLDAGFHIELAGGGHYNPAALRSKVAEIQTKIPAGSGFQLPLWQEMRKEGLPIEGFCVAAGIPSTEKAAEIIGGLRDAGIRHVSFKPGSVEGIRQVVAIAASNPDFPVILQWTGGRAGGHHSYEDFHQPVLQTYRSIRQQSNISLVGGSGFGAAEDVWPYLTGEWALKYETQPMPFDGFLFASRVMVAKEAHTSPSVKDLIVAAAGVDDADWEGTYVKPTGGILTVNSGRSSTIKMPKEKRAAWLLERRDEIIGKLNRDFSKPWFGWKDDSVAKDLGDMTYEETVLRMRFAGVNGGGHKPSLLQSYTSLDDPLPFIDAFFKEYLIATKQLLAAEDSAYFLAISQRPGQKPVPFIPVLDATFEVWFKKDSLWAAEDIEAVFDQDPQRVCILQGPMAVKHSKVKDQPIREMLGNIHNELVQRLLASKYDNDVSKVPTVDYLSAKPTSAPVAPCIKRVEGNNEVVYEISKLPETSAWLETLAGPELSWLRALTTSTTIVQGTSYIDNPMKRLLAPRVGQKVVVCYNDALPVSVTVYGAARSFGEHKQAFKAVEIVYSPADQNIGVTIFEDRRDVSVPLTLQFAYKPSQGFAPIHEIATDRNNRIKAFY